ncbi:hypothetical protein BVX93_00665 [bacterium B13(2017)]|nr:hypothetical protein BVX93_00665 [bacterium B13(2017)]
MIWKKSDIKYARKINLVIILKKLGYSLRKLDNDNYLVDKFASVIVKENYWFCKTTKKAGNAIDFFVKFERKTFMEAMDILLK